MVSVAALSAQAGLVQVSGPTPQLDWGTPVVVSAATKSALTNQTRGVIFHSVQSALFEVLENGVLSTKRVALGLDVSWSPDRSTWAEVRIVLVTIVHEKKRIELDSYYCSTNSAPATIENLKVQGNGFSLDMYPYPMAPDRPIRLVATRRGVSNKYEVAGTGLWTALFGVLPLQKIEWRQVTSFNLPYSLVGID
jgi:hypothetical protein